jgi:transposase
MARMAYRDPIHLGLDVHRDTISVATLLPDAAAAAVEQIPSDEAAVLAFVGRFAEPGRLRVCYEAGPTGYELARLLHSRGVACQVIAPSLTPRAVGDKVKTDRRDCRRLARLHRAGELVAIRIPTAHEEAVRDLCRARADLVDDRSRARRRLQSLLLRHGRVYRAGACWTGKHERWLGAQRFDDHQLQATFAHDRAVVATRDAEVSAIEADLAEAAMKPPFADAVCRLAAYRGVASWARYRWPLRSATGGGSPTRRRSWPSPGWCPANAPQATASGVATSPAPAANIYGSSWWSQPGRIITAP